MAAIAVHKFAQCITCHAWSPDHSSKCYYSSLLLQLLLIALIFVLFCFHSVSFPRKRRKRNAQLMDPIRFVFTGEFDD